MRDEIREGICFNFIPHPSSLIPSFTMRESFDAYIPQVAFADNDERERLLQRRKIRARVVWLITVFGSLLLLALIFAAPLAAHAQQTFIARFIYQSFHFVCHQMPERSFHLNAHPLAVCARCFGLYAGFALAVCAYPFVHSLENLHAPSRIFLVLAALPLGVDWILGFTGIWANTHLSRLATGALFGAACAFYVVPILVNASRTARQGHSLRASDAPFKRS